MIDTIVEWIEYNACIGLVVVLAWCISVILISSIYAHMASIKGDDPRFDELLRLTFIAGIGAFLFWFFTVIGASLYGSSTYVPDAWLLHLPKVEATYMKHRLIREQHPIDITEFTNMVIRHHTLRKW